jgi:hypothetical protein
MKPRGKNITLQVSDELYQKMLRYPEVKWSRVAEQAIEVYIKHRETTVARLRRSR